MRQRLTSIRAKLETLKRLDAECDLADSYKHSYQLNAPLAPDQIAQFEAKYDLRLPDDYRAFLLEIGDGGAGPYDGLPRLEAAEGDLDGSFPLQDFFDVTDADAAPADAYESKWTAGALMLSDQGCGMHDFLVVKGEGAGQMWQDNRANGFGIFPLARNRDELGASQEDTMPYTIAETPQERLSFTDWFEWWLDWSLQEIEALNSSR